MPAQQNKSASGTAPPHDGARLAALDALRGLAIVLVVIGHYLPGHAMQGEMQEFLGPWAIGGVILFFFLSGFLIARNLSGGNSLAGYGLRRVFRIMPAYWVSILALLVVHRLVLKETDFAGPRDVIFNALLLQDIGHVPLMNDAFWTLLIEAKFYVVAPLVILGGRRLTYVVPYLTMLANAVLLARRGEASNLLTYLMFCFVGMNFHFWYRKELGDVALGLLVVCAAIAVGFYSPYFKVGLAVFDMINAALLAIALRHGRPLPWLGFIGAISYSWYLYHGGLGFPLMAALESSFLMPPLVSSLIVACITLIVAWVSYRLIERPGIGFGQMLERYVRNAKPVAVPR
jgi:peptidoglycan/LPS O-acetylase OafA/YrhL